MFTIYFPFFVYLRRLSFYLHGFAILGFTASDFAFIKGVSKLTLWAEVVSSILVFFFFTICGFVVIFALLLKYSNYGLNIILHFELPSRCPLIEVCM